MLSFRKYFLFRRISKYIRKNLTAEPSHSAAPLSRDFLDIMKLNEDIPEDEFCEAYNEDCEGCPYCCPCCGECLKEQMTGEEDEDE